MVNLFHRSTVAKNELTKTQIETIGTDYVLILDVITRWNSTFDMFERVLMLQSCIEATLTAMDKQNMNLTDNEWESLSQMCMVLQPFKDVTVELSAENYVSLSKLIPMIRILKSHLDKVVEKVTIAQILQLIETLKGDIENRFREIEYEEHASMATYLDPRFKSLAFSSNDALEYVESRIKTKLQLMNEEQVEVSPKRTPQAARSNSSILTNFWTEFDEEIESNISRELEINDEFQIYKNIVNIERSQDPLFFWKDNKKRLPRLAELAKEYLGCPGSSVPSERVFSKTGTVDSDKRNRLSGELVGKIVFLNINAPLIN